MRGREYMKGIYFHTVTAKKVTDAFFQKMGFEALFIKGSPLVWEFLRWLVEDLKVFGEYCRG